MATPGSAKRFSRGIWGLLSVPHLLLGLFLLFTVGKSILTLLGILQKGPSDQGIEKASLAVIPIGLVLSASMLATAVGLLRRRRTAYYVSAVFTVMLLSGSMATVARSGSFGIYGLALGALLAVLHVLGYPALQD